MKFPQLFAALKKIREFERAQFPFVRSLVEFDIIIEIGHAQEEKRALTPKQLFLLKLGSVTTVRRRLAKLTAQGVVTRRSNSEDYRSDLLTLSPFSLKVLDKYGSVLSGIVTAGR
jgi:DNA-binding MarR family transcriptional regulator